MKRHILTNFAFAAVIIGTITVMIHSRYGWRGATAYLLYAILCLLPAAVKARSFLGNKKKKNRNEMGIQNTD